MSQMFAKLNQSAQMLRLYKCFYGSISVICCRVRVDGHFRPVKRLRFISVSRTPTQSTTIAMAGRVEKVKKLITSHPDFPKKGILFRDIFPVLRNCEVFRDLIDLLVERVRDSAPDAEAIVGLESRGFLFGPIMADRLNMAFIPVRKAGKLPGECCSVTYSLEYGQDKFEVQKEALKKGQSVVIVDDLLATGGTMRAAIDLMSKVGAEVAECLVVIELEDLKGRDKLDKPIHSLIQY